MNKNQTIHYHFTAMDEIENFLRNAKYPEGLAKGEKANFRRKVNNNYKLDGGQLYYKKAGDNGADTSVWKICVRNEEEKGRILKSCHEGLGGALIFHSLCTLILYKKIVAYDRWTFRS